MMRGLTPTLTLALKESVDFSAAKNVYFTVRQGPITVTKTGDSVTFSDDAVSVYLTQKDTLRFKAGVVEVQANWTYADGSRGGTEIVTREMGDNLLPMVLE